MSLYLPELDDVTRSYMIREFDDEQAASPYMPSVLTGHGQVLWPGMMRSALEFGDDVSLINDLLGAPSTLHVEETYVRQGVVRRRRVNLRQVAERLGTSEFNTWYVRGLAARFIDEGISHVMVYRAADPRWAPAGCADHEGQIVPMRDVYDGHRARYWPTENPAAFSVPFQPGCHHSIARVA